jgi:ribosomal protein S28E/S33
MSPDMEQMRVALLNAFEAPQTIRNVAGMLTRGEVLALGEALRLVRADDVAEMWEQENADSQIV